MTIAPNRPTGTGTTGTLRQRLRFAATRTGPRLGRGAGRACSVTRGLLVALAVTSVLAGLFACWAWVSHPRWSRFGTATADLLGRWQLLAGSAALLLLATALLGPTHGLTVVVALPAALVWGVRAARAVYPHTVRGRVRTRYGHDGWASWWDLHRHVSAHAVRHTTATMRPSLASQLPDDDGPDVGQRASAAARRRLAVERLPVSQCGTWLGTATVGPVLGRSCYAAHRDVVGLIAPPQTAKTALMGHHVIDHPGAVLTTSTKPDVYGHTATLRARRARSGRVEVFNPEGLGDVDSTMRWSPVLGCDNPATAAERAGALVGATSAAGGEDGTFWLDSAAKVLRSFLMAAALGGLDMRAVQQWVADPARAAEKALELLQMTHRERVPTGWGAELAQVLHTDAKRTRESIFLTLSQSVAFMADPQVAAACCPAEGEPVFDVARFLDDQSTLYLIMSERPHASVAPLAAAFTTHVFEQAKRIASRKPKGRLDPPLGLILDEAALTTPVPLDRWVADAGGRGIHIVWSVQSPSQLAQRWDRTGADTIWNATNAKIVFGGLTLDGDLEAISRLCGDRREEIDDGDGKLRTERVRVLPVDRLRTLPQWHGLLIHRTTPVTIVRIRPVWERHDVKAAGSPLQPAPIDEVLRPRHDHQARLPASAPGTEG